MRIVDTAWCIELENFRGGNEIYHFDSFELAKESFNNLIEQFKDYPEFRKDINGIYVEWFDSSYNEYLTMATMHLDSFVVYEEPVTDF